MFSPLDQFDVIRVFSLIGVQLPFINIIIPFILVIFIFFFYLSSFKFSFKIIPTKIQRFYEALFEFIFNLVKQQIGTEGYRYFPLIFSLFQFVLFLNLLSLVPFGIALTSHIIMIM